MATTLSPHRQPSPYQVYKATTAAKTSVQSRLWLSDESISDNNKVASTTVTDMSQSPSLTNKTASSGRNTPSTPEKHHAEFPSDQLRRRISDSTYGSPKISPLAQTNSKQHTQHHEFLPLKDAPLPALPIIYGGKIGNSFNDLAERSFLPRDSVSASKLRVSSGESKPSMKTCQSETALADAFARSKLPPSRRPYAHSARPSISGSIKPPLPRVGFASNTNGRGSIDSGISVCSHTGLEQRMQSLETQLNVLVPTIERLSMAMNNLATAFELNVGQAPTRVYGRSSIVSRRASGTSSSTLHGQPTPRVALFDQQVFDHRRLGSVSEQGHFEDIGPTYQHGGATRGTAPINLDLIGPTSDGDDEDEGPIIEQLPRRTRQQSVWESETDSDGDSGVDPLGLSPARTESNNHREEPRLETSPTAQRTSLRSSVAKKASLIFQKHRPPMVTVPKYVSNIIVNQSEGTGTISISGATSDRTLNHDGRESKASWLDTTASNPLSATSVKIRHHDTRADTTFPGRLFIDELSPKNQAFPPSFSVNNISMPVSPRTCSPAYACSPHTRSPLTQTRPPALLRATSSLVNLASVEQPAPRAGWYFFYGALCSPTKLQQVLNLPHVPEMRAATVRGRMLKYCGIRPVAVCDLRVPSTRQVNGFAWYVPNGAMAEWIRRFEQEDGGVAEVGAEIQLIENEDGDVSPGHVNVQTVLGRMYEWRGVETGLADGPAI